jgi:hypothetical protein
MVYLKKAEIKIESWQCKKTCLTTLAQDVYSIACIFEMYRKI